MNGKAFKFGDNISTDHIAPGRLYHLRSNLPEFAKHVLEDADENFAKAQAALEKEADYYRESYVAYNEAAIEYDNLVKNL